MENNDKKKKIILAVIGVLVLLVGIVGLTYAYFIAQGQSEDITVTSKNLKLVFDDSTPVINATDIEPIEEDEILTKATKKTFRISKESSSGKDLYVRLDMTDLVVSDNFKDFDLKWALYKGEEKITTGTFVPTLDGTTSINMATNILINSTTPIEYNLYIWINETGLDQERLMDGTLSGKITAVGEVKSLNTLASNILKENVKNDIKIIEYEQVIEENKSVNVTSSSNRILSNSYLFDSTTGNYTLTGTIVENASFGTNYIDYYTCNINRDKCKTMYKIKAVDGTSVILADKYTINPTQKDKGLYVQKDNNEKSEFGFPTYYYRGSVENNYVQLGTYKSDVTNTVYKYIEEYDDYDEEETIVAHQNDSILFRIVRVNEDGSIKLIDENSIKSKHPWDANNPSKYTIDNKDSELKQTIDNWYITNITKKEISDKIQTTSFCNDITDIDFSTFYANGNAYKRLAVNKEPIFKCPNGSIIANEKAGSLTADELMYAGLMYSASFNENISYLNNNTSFWTISPISSFQGFYFSASKKQLDYISGRDNYASARAVINLKSDVIINAGDGTKTNPYIIKY